MQKYFAVNCFCCCQKVEKDENGLNTLHEVGLSWEATKLPISTSEFVIYASLLFFPEEYGHHKVSLGFRNPDGSPIDPLLDIEIDVASIGDGTQHHQINVPFTLPHITFSEFGTYWAELLLDDKSISILPLVVKEWVK